MTGENSKSDGKQLPHDSSSERPVEQALSKENNGGESAVSRTPDIFHEAHEIYINLVDNAPIGIYIVQDGDIIFGNKWLQDFSGYMEDDLPMSALNVIAPEERAFVADQMVKRLQGKDAYPNYPVKFLKKDGSTVYVELIARVVNFCGRPAIQGSIVDISEKVAALKKLGEYSTQLEYSNHLKQLFNEILSHDLLNRLWLVENYAKFILESGVTEGQENDLQALNRCVKSAIGILNNAHIYIKLTEKMELDFHDLNIVSLLREVIDDFSLQAEDKKLKIQFLPEKDLSVRGSHFLKAAFTNLISNAVKYSPDGSTVIIEMVENAHLKIRIIDRGKEIPEEYREKIFQRFERLRNESIKGVGLGLAIVQRVIDLHGGRVWVEANPEGGNIFTVELPS